VSGVPAGLGVRVTPDDGVRLSGTRVWDESLRPHGPPPEPGRAYTARGRSVGAHLVEVHDHLRRELDQVRDVVRQVREGVLEIGAARSELNEMALRQNSWTLGGFCETYCRVVTGHHSLEDQAVFPHLRSADPRLAAVIDRLQEEHRAIHHVLDGVDASLVHLVGHPDDIDQVAAAVDLLADTLLSHLSYEESELVEPLARLGFYDNQV
jgi:hemerythrin-like domain-containing protein